MTALEKTIEWQNNHGTHPFTERLIWNLHNGIVHCTPQVFFMAHEMNFNPQNLIVDYTQPPNAWFVEMATVINIKNPMASLMKLLTHSRKYVLWLRLNSPEPHVYKWEKLAKRLGINEGGVI
jgi:hypothetical protein